MRKGKPSAKTSGTAQLKPAAETAPKISGKAKVAKPAVKNPATAKAVRDAFGGRVGTRMSAINVVVIKAGAKGATVPEVVETTGESASVVGAQLGWMVSHKKVATRKEEMVAGRKSFRYFAKLS